MRPLMMDFTELTVLILVGGLGTRLRQAVPDKPKALVDINDRPFLTYLLDRIGAAGLKSVVLCTGYLAETIREIIGDRYGKIDIRYSRETEPLGTGGALKLAGPLIDSDFVLAMNGDSYVDTDLEAFFNWSMAVQSGATIMLTRVDDVSRYGQAIVSEGGKIVRFEEKCHGSCPGWINTGIYLLNNRLIECIPSDTFYSLEHDFFPGLIGTGLYGYRCDAPFIDIGTPMSYIQAQEFFQHFG